MSTYRWPNLAAMFFDQVDRKGDRPFLWAKRGGAYHPLGWGDVAARVVPLARGLISLGVKPGDRFTIFSRGDDKKEYVDKQGIYFYVQCANCGKTVRLRADKQYDLSSDGGGNSGLGLALSQI